MVPLSWRNKSGRVRRKGLDREAWSLGYAAYTLGLTYLAFSCPFVDPKHTRDLK